MGETDPTNLLSTVAAVTRNPLHVLLVDDSQDDVELVVGELRRGGYEPTWERVDTAAALTAALDREPWDVITCDWVMPQFSGPAALALLQERQVDVPIIIVSGQVGEEYAVTAMKAGAHDFVSKQKLARLCPAIERELKETQVRWEHKQAGKALAAAHSQLRLITDNMLDLLSFVSLDAVLQYVSPSHQRILGYAPEDLLGRRAFEFFHPEDVAPVTSAFEAGIKNHTTGRVEFRHRHADGHYVWLEAVGRPFFDDHGSVVGVVVNGRDITERKQAELEYRTILQTASDGFWILDVQGNILDVNEAYCQLSGYSRAELLTMNVRDIEAVESASEVTQHIRQVMEAGHGHFEVHHRRKDGRVLEIAISTNFRDVAGGRFFVFLRDVAERKRAEGAMRLQSQIARNIAEGVYLVSAEDLRIVYANPKMEEMFGYAPGEMNGKHVSIINAPIGGDPVQTARQIEKALTETGSWRGEVLNVKKDGTPFWGQASISMLHHPEYGKVYVSLQMDITERKQAEAVLRGGEERLRLAQKAAQVVTWDWDLLSGMTTWSSPIAADLGLPPGTFDGTYEGFLAVVHPKDREYVRQAVARAISDDADYDVEFRLMRPDGGIQWGASRGHALRNESGQAVRMLGVSRDITDRKLAEETLRLTQFAMDQASDPIFWTDTDGRFLYVNNAASRQLGYPRDHLLRMHVWDIAPDYPAQRWPGHWDELKEKGTLTFETRHRRQDGTIFPVELTVTYLQHGEREFACAFTRDITERRQAQAALALSEERFRLAMLGANDGLWDWNIKTDAVYYSPRWKSMLGYAEDELEPHLDTWKRLVHPEDRERTLALVSDLMEGRARKYEVEFRVRHKDGHYVDILSRAFLARDERGEAACLVGTHVDISERKRAEEALRQSEERFSSAFEHAAIGMGLVGLGGRWLRVNQALCDLTGYSADELTVKTFQDITHPDDLDADLEYVRQLLAAEIRNYHMEKRYLHKRGQVVWILLSVSLVRDAQGKPLHFIAQIQNITERKQAEQALRTSEERTRLIIDNAFDAVIAMSAEGTVTGWNPGAQTMFGWSCQEVVGRPLHDMILPPRYRQAHQRGLEHFLTTGEGSVLNKTVEMTALHRDGHEFPIEMSVWLVRVQDSLTFSAFVRDITERKRAEEETQRLQAQLEQRVRERTAQLEAANKELETFSYSVSHDLRAPLRAVDGFSATLLDRYGPQFDAQGRHYLQRVREGTQHMGELINDLLGLSRITRTEMHRQPVDLGALARTIAADLRKAQPERQVEFVIADDVVVEGDAGLLGSALENLLGNAWKYTSRHPTARIEFGVSHQDGQPVYFVRDDGAGFDMAYVGKLFGAFQRLHAADDFEGSGIGLATVQRIIHRHGGRVWAEGTVEQGSTFYFTLSEAAVHHEDSPTENEAPGGTLTAR